MNITNVIDYVSITDYDDITCTNMTSFNCTNNENKIDIITPLLRIMSCVMSLICLFSLMIYTSIKHLMRKI